MGSALFLSGCAVVPQSINGDAARVMGMETREALRSGQESYGEIDLPRAIALAVQQNRDYRLNLMESTLAIADLEVSNLDMLPDLTARAGYRMRSEPVESFSESDGQISNQPSISQEKNQTNAELSFGWSVLDFGLSMCVHSRLRIVFSLQESENERLSKISFSTFAMPIGVQWVQNGYCPRLSR